MILAVALAACAISGRVLDPSGRGVEGVPVTASRALPPTPVSGASTDARGEYCIPSLPEGVYLLRIPQAPGRMELGTCDTSSTWQLPGRPSAKTGTRIDLHVTRTHTYCITGEIRDETGTLVSGVDVGLAVEGGSLSMRSPDGRFAISGLRPGVHKIAAGGRTHLIRVGRRHVRGVVLRVHRQ